MQVEIAMVGKYTDLSDAYLSVIKSLQHACLAANRKLEILWVEASHLEEQSKTDDSEAFHVRISVLIMYLPKYFHSICEFLMMSMGLSGRKACHAEILQAALRNVSCHEHVSTKHSSVTSPGMLRKLTIQQRSLETVMLTEHDFTGSLGST